MNVFFKSQMSLKNCHHDGTTGGHDVLATTTTRRTRRFGYYDGTVQHNVLATTTTRRTRRFGYYDGTVQHNVLATTTTRRTRRFGYHDGTMEHEHIFFKFQPGRKSFPLLLPVLLLSLFFFSACGDKNRAPHPDISGIKADVKILRFEQDIFALDTAQLQAGMQQLTLKYPVMMPLFCTQIIHDESNQAETPRQALAGFLSAPPIRHLYDTVQQVYGNLRWLEKDLNLMFRYYQYYFPKKPVPQVVSMISEYTTDAFTMGDSLCGIGLDMFLGEEYPGYNPDLFPYFLRRQFQKDYIPVRLAKAIAQNSSGEPTGRRLLDMMLDNGKQLYITDCLLPDVADSLKMGYTRVQMEGCYTNEQEVWARLLSANLLYSTDFDKIRKLVTPSPNAPVIFQEAPGEIGNWVGWQIVRSYMKRYPKTTMEQLLQMKDSQKFLELARYKPARN